MVEAYWNIGKSIIEEQGGHEKAEYGYRLAKKSCQNKLTQDFGKGFTVANLKNYEAVLFDVSKWLAKGIHDLDIKLTIHDKRPTIWNLAGDRIYCDDA